MTFATYSLGWMAALAVASTTAAITPNDWQFTQPIEVASPGLMRVNLPAATLDAARSGLEDLRVVDQNGAEVPYLIDRPMPRPESLLSPKEIRSSLQPDATVITIETGTSSIIAGVSLEAARGSDFIKAARVEGSPDGTTWQEIATGEPLFVLGGGATKLRIALPEAAWRFLRLTIDDARTAHVPFTGARLHTPTSSAPTEPMAITIKSRDENPGVTRLALDLGAANLTLSSLRIDASDALFTRAITVAVPEVGEEGIRERPLLDASIYRVNLNGKSDARLPIDRLIATRELILLIHNQDSPPLAINGVSGERRVVRLLFFARDAGRFTLLTGNTQCAAPRYDFSAMGDDLKNAPSAELAAGPIATNAGYKPSEALAALTLVGSSIDVSGWKFRRPVQLVQPGAQQLELDLNAIARAQADGRDLRLVRDGHQLPFLLERTSISRAIPLTASAANDPKRPTLSRWTLKMPQAALPITRLVCSSSAPLFQREMRLWEDRDDERGDHYRRGLGRASWKQLPNHATPAFEIQLDERPSTGTLMLETDNGDNPPIDLRDFRGYYPATRLVFKASPNATYPVSLYYGNASAAPARYDLSLVAGELLRASRSTATLGPPDNVTSASGRATEALAGWGRVVFWAVLAVVVVGLLFLISRLLPKAVA